MCITFVLLHLYVCVLQDEHPLHWPMVKSDHMRQRLALKEFELKRIEDSKR